MSGRELRRHQTNPEKTLPLFPSFQQTHFLKLEIPTAEVIPSPAFESTQTFLSTALSSHNVFSLLRPEDQSRLIHKLTYYHISEDEIIYETGLPARLFYLLHTGEVLRDSNGVREVITPGNSFGDPTLILGSPRTDSARSSQKCRFWTLSADDFRLFLGIAREEVREEIQTFQESSPFLRNLEVKYKKNLSKFGIYQNYPANSLIIREGTFGSLFFFLMRGEVAIRKGQKTIRVLFQGDFFGEQALLYTGIRTADVLALTDCSLLGIDKHHIPLVFDASFNHFIYVNSLRIALAGSLQLSKRLSPDQIETLIPLATINTYAYGEVVIHKKTDYIFGVWIVLRGSLVVLEETGVSRPFGGVFECLNEDLGMGSSGKFGFNVIAGEDEVAVAEISRSDLVRISSADFCRNEESEILQVNEVVELGLFKGISMDKIITFGKLARKVSFQEEEEVSKTVLSGYLCILSSGAVLQEFALRKRVVVSAPGFFWCWTRKGKEQVTKVTCKTQCECWLLHKSYFKAVFSTLSPISIEHILSRSEPKGTLSSLTFLAKVSKTASSSLFVASDSGKRMLFIKRTSKKKAYQHPVLRQLLRERELLQQLTHPLVVKFLQTILDNKYLYYVMEYIPGEVFSEVLARHGALPESHAQVYAIMLVSILSALHNDEIVHRNLNPDSFFLDVKGVLRLTDLSMGRVLEDRTSSVCGIPQYMPPEIVRNSTYGKAVDLWSLGVLLFRLVYGRLPFGDSEEDPYIIYKEILTQEMKVIPGFCLTPACTSLISKLLSKEPGSRGTISILKHHPWFLGVNWVFYIQESINFEGLSPMLFPSVPEFEGCLGINKSRLRSSMVKNT